MDEPDPSGSDKTTKGQRTRARIRECAFTLFAEHGYEATTMRMIAERAECALGLIYRYFPRREDLVLALYRDNEDATLVRWQRMRGGTLAERVEKAMRLKLETVWPHRATFRAVIGMVLDPDSGAGIFSPETTSLRELTRAGWREVVTGASDPPTDSEVEPLVEALFVAHLGILLAATQDPREDARATKALIKSFGEIVARFRPLLPLAVPLLTMLAAHVAAFEKHAKPPA